jgi:hypothetical protein
MRRILLAMIDVLRIRPKHSDEGFKESALT